MNRAGRRLDDPVLENRLGEGRIGEQHGADDNPGGDDLIGEDLHRVRGGHTVLSGAHLVAPAGALTVVVGPNGAGKSTLLASLAGADLDGPGRVMLGDIDLAFLRRRQRALRAALVDQDSATDAALTVEEAVALGRTPHRGLLGAPAAGDADAVHEALTATGLLPHRRRTLATLSGGERQRVHIARGLAQETPLLILDEPTNHLDVAAALDVLHLLQTLAADGRTVVAALHDLSLAAAHADHVVVLDSGTVVAAGPPAQALTAEVIERVYGVRAMILSHPTSGRPVIAFERRTS